MALSVLGKAPCSFCGRIYNYGQQYELQPPGTINGHNSEDTTVFPPYWCAGSWEPPAAR